MKINNILSNFFSLRWYMGIGRSKANEILGFIPELLMIDLWFSNKGIELGNISYLLIPVVIISFILGGLAYKKSGLYDLEISKSVEKTKISQEQLDKLREIYEVVMKK